MRPDSVGLGGFDSHTFPPRARVLAFVLLLLCPTAAHAQKKANQPPISPGRAFLASALLPGLGQAPLRRGTGLLFVTAEAIGLTMYGKSRHDLAIAKAYTCDSTPLSFAIDPVTGIAKRDSVGALVVASWTASNYSADRVHARRTHVEDWLAVLIFNHLFAAIDALVAAQLWELPAQVEFRAMPRGLAVRAGFHW